MTYTVRNDQAMSRGGEKLSLSEAIDLAIRDGGGRIEIKVPMIRFPLLDENLMSALPVISVPVEIRGPECGCILQGSGRGCCIILEASDCCLTGISCAGFSEGVWIRPRADRLIENIRIEHCGFNDCALAGIITGYDQSRTGIRNLQISDCLFSSAMSERDPTVRVQGTRFALILAAALQTERHEDICDNVLENVSFSSCRIVGEKGFDYAEGCFFLGAYDFGYACRDLSNYMTAGRGCARSITVRKILAADNVIEGVYDGGMFAAGASCGISLKEVVLEDICFLRNRITHGLAGIGVNGIDQYGFGEKGSESEHVRMRRVHICHNHLKRVNPAPKERSQAVVIWGSLIENGICRESDCLLEEIEIAGNQVEDSERGIVLEAARAFAAETYLSYAKKNEIRKVRISDNRFSKVQIPIVINAAHYDGREDFFSVHGPVPEDPIQPYGAWTEDALVDQVVVSANHASDFDLFIRQIGADLGGNAMARNCRIGTVAVEDNEFEKGGKVYFKTRLKVDALCYDNSRIGS